MESPIIVSITELRHQAASVVEQAATSGRPVFVTQHGHATAVILSRSMYDRLLRGRERDDVPADRSSPEESTVILDPLAVFGPLPPGTLFETKWGRVDRETAAFFAEIGVDVRPDIRRR